MKTQKLMISAIAALTVAFVGSPFAGTDIRADARRLVEAVPVSTSFLTADVQDVKQLAARLVAKGGDTGV